MTDSIKIDKLDENFNIRIPSCIKAPLADLPPENKKHLHIEILKLMADEVHRSRLNYNDYLSTESKNTL
jgi:hypothetical protein